MKSATLAFFAMLLLAPSTAFARAVESRPAAPPQSQPQNPAPAAKPVDAPAGPRVGDRKRRVSYARCNRLSHEKNLRGGTRRRFMIRCRLGYEKPRQPQQQPVPPAPVQAQSPQTPPPTSAPAAPAPAKRP